MARPKSRSDLYLSSVEIAELEEIAKSRTRKHSEVQRARILLAYAANVTITDITKNEKISRPAVERCIDKALSTGYRTALSDLQRTGRPATITADAKTWVVHIACCKPFDLGLAAERWTLDQLSTYVKKHCSENGFDCLSQVNKTAIKRILDEQPVQPHKTNYYLVKKDPEFEPKMVQILLVYQEVNQMNDHPEQYDENKMATVSYDEKPGIQAISGIAPDLSPKPNQYSCWGRDYEYKRLGTVSLLAGIDLHDGHIFSLVRDRHRSIEFIEFLKMLDEYYDPSWQIRIILDNHSAHVSKETMKWLKDHPNRFKLVYTPKHGSWLNMIEIFFSKMTRSFMRSLRVKTKDELVQRLEQYIGEVNADPVVFRWKYRIDDLQV